MCGVFCEGGLSPLFTLPSCYRAVFDILNLFQIFKILCSQICTNKNKQINIYTKSSGTPFYRYVWLKIKVTIVSRVNSYCIIILMYKNIDKLMIMIILLWKRSKYIFKVQKYIYST